MLIFDTFANEETNHLIELNRDSSVILIFTSIFMLLIPLFLANTLIKRQTELPKLVKEKLTFTDFLIAFLAIIAYPLFEYAYTTRQGNINIHKASLLESSYYKNLSADEKDYFKLELLGENNGCKNNISCQDGFNYQIKLKDIDQIITDIKKQRETKTPPQTTPDIGNQLNKKFWELIQK